MGNRQQFVQMGDYISTCLDITVGVLQGSVLGPKLFMLNINVKCLVSGKVKSDDTLFFVL